MALANVLIHAPGGQHMPAAKSFKTEAGSTAIVAGDLVKVGGTGGNFAVQAADGEPTTAAPILGVASSTSSHTASLNGSVDVLIPTADMVWEAKAKVAASVDTEAELLAVLNDRVPMDLTAGVWTIDAAAGDGATNGCRIVGGDPSKSVVHFVFLPNATNMA